MSVDVIRGELSLIYAAAQEIMDAVATIDALLDDPPPGGVDTGQVKTSEMGPGQHAHTVVQSA